MMKDEKIKIENSADLYKLPIHVIKNTKLYNFQGKYFDKIYEEALKIERSGGNVEEIFKPKIKVNEIFFEISFKTEFGQRLVVCGSSREMGEWDIKSALCLTWSEGNIWRAQVPFSENFEYKFVFLENNKVKKWEGGENRKFSFTEVKELIEEISDFANKESVTLEKKFPEEYTYNHKNSSLNIACTWRN